jgi:hypothetical protein
MTTRELFHVDPFLSLTLEQRLDLKHGTHIGQFILRHEEQEKHNRPVNTLIGRIILEE